MSGASRTLPRAPVIYARISLDRTGEALGIQRQIDACRERAAVLGWPEPVVLQDNDISARSGKRRPAFEALLDQIRSGEADGLLAWHLDRLLRRIDDLSRVLDAIQARREPFKIELIQSEGVDLGSDTGRMLAYILAAVAANEGDVKASRLRAQRAQQAHAGRAHGPLGYGYDAEQRIIPTEAAVVREVATRMLDGESLYSIATDLNARGVATPGAGKWDARRVARAALSGQRPEVAALVHAARSNDRVEAARFARLIAAARGDADSANAAWVRAQPWWEHLAAADHGLDDGTIARLLADAGIAPDRSHWRAGNLRAMIRRGSLAGWREFSPGKRGGSGELVAEGDWTAILSRETLDQIRQITDRTGVRQPGREPKYLLAGILKCGKCGSSLGGGPDGRGGHRYSCSKQPGRERTCGGLTVAGAPVDRIVSQAVIDVLADAQVRAGKRVHGSVTDEAVQRAQEELASIEALREDYAREAAAGSLRPDEWRIVREGLDRRQREAERILGSWAPNLRSLLSDVPQQRGEVEAWWAEAPMRRRREVVKALIESIPVAPAGRSAQRFDPERLGVPVWRV